VDAGYPHFPAARHPFRASFSGSWVVETVSGSGGARYGRDLRLAIPGLARGLLPARGAAAALAGVLRRAVRHRGEQRDLLPAPVAGGVRELAGPGPRGLRHDREGQPLPQPRAAAARPGRSGPQAAGRGVRARRPARARAAPASAGPARRPGTAGRMPAAVPGGGPGRGGVQARVLVDRPGAGRAGGRERGAVLGGPPGVRGHAAVADGRLGIPAAARGGRVTVAGLHRRHARRVGGAARGHLGRRPRRVRLLQQRPERRGAAGRGPAGRGRHPPRGASRPGLDRVGRRRGGRGLGPRFVRPEKS
jgi:hypothetical protein